jgi:hypothetical protein
MKPHWRSEEYKESKSRTVDPQKMSKFCNDDRKNTPVNYWLSTPTLKGIESILFLKNGLKKNCPKHCKNYLRSNNYEICTAVAHCFPNILDAIVFENINLFEDKIGRPPIVI